ncbi:MAG: DUF1428 domain-containing protein [Tabrizicola sp.]|jgi:uncharacterized protein YbaA (DUF1428 family)|nr:DUF1428 domain-containing protein [Tabrizicola sp.]
MYVDGYVVPVKRDRIEEYRKLSAEMAAAWLRHGALSVVECMGDDVPDGEVTSFPMAVKLEPGEVVVFSWITYRDRADRDRVNAKVMEESGPDMEALMQGDPPMNPKRMIWGGFAPILHEVAKSG